MKWYIRKIVQVTHRKTGTQNKEMINKLWYIHSKADYKAMRMNKPMLYAAILHKDNIE